MRILVLLLLSCIASGRRWRTEEPPLVEGAATLSSKRRHNREYDADPSNQVRALSTVLLGIVPSIVSFPSTQVRSSVVGPSRFPGTRNKRISYPKSLNRRRWMENAILIRMSSISEGENTNGPSNENADQNTAAHEQTKMSRRWLEASDKDPGFLRSAIAGGIAACLATVAFHPVDTVKTLLQGGASYLAVRSLGIIGLYRGVLPAALSMMPACAVRMGSYEVLKRVLLQLALLRSIPQSVLVFLASALSVVASCSVRAPLDLVKTCMQTDASSSAMGALSSAWGVGGLTGIAGMYRGAGLALVRDVPFFGFNLLFYEQLKARLLAKKASRASIANSTDATPRSKLELSALESLLIGFVAQGFAGFLTNPADVLKTRVQSGSVSMSFALQQALAEGGPMALMAGAGMRVLWIAPQGCIYYPVYEFVKRLLA